MIKLDTVRRLLATADVRQDPYAVAEGGLALLTMDSRDGVAAAHYIRALAAMGLGVAARRVATAIGAGQALRQQLEAVPAGVVPWSSRRRRFAANIKALSEQWPAAETVGAAWDRVAGRYELHVVAGGTTGGGLHVWDTAKPVGAGWLAGFVDHRAAVDGLWHYDRGRDPLPSPVAFDGIGHGWLIQRVLETTEQTYLQYSCAVYVVEPDLAALAMALHMQDLQAWLRHPRLRVYAGAGAVERFSEDLGRRDDWSLPSMYLRDRLTESGGGRLQDVGQKLVDERVARRNKIRERVAGLYAGKDATHWARRFVEARSGGPPLRVLGLTSRYTTVLQYSMEELQAAVRAATGAARAEMELVREPDDQSLENMLPERLEEFQPDLIVQLSRMRYENPELPKEVPFLCWDQDSLSCMRTAQATASLDALTYVAGYGAIHGYHQLGWPLGNCICVHQAGATHRYADAPLPEETLARYRCDFSFVSNASATPEELRGQMQANWRNTPFAALYELASRRIVETSEAGKAWFAEDLPEFLRKAAVLAGALHSDGVPGDLLHDIRTLADRCFRHSTLHWVSRWCLKHGRTLKLYGKGWEQHAVFKAHAAGMAQPGEEMRAIYQATTINLQIIESGFLHARALDGLAAGGFFITRYSPNDGDDMAAIREIYELSCWLRKNPAVTEAELAEAGDPVIRRRWEIAQKYFAHHGVPEMTRHALPVWQDTPATAMALPHVEEITFRDEESFGKLAERFLADAGARETIRREMRAAVVEKFSYDARWRRFLEAISEGLTAAAGETMEQPCEMCA